MNRLTLKLPSAEFSIRAPAELVESLRLFYPHSVRATAASCPRAEFDIEAGAGEWTLSRNGRTVGSFSEKMQALLALEFEIESLVAQADKGYIALHAGGVATKNGAWLVAGNPDTGKTSSTFHLLELDQAFLCEEIALYEAATRRVLPYPQALAVESGFVSDFRTSFEITSGELVSFDNQLMRFLPRRVCAEARVLQAVLLPRFRPGSRPSVEALAPESVLTEFLGYCFPPQHGEETLYDSVISLLNETQLYRVTYGNAREARDLLAGLLASVAPPAS